MDSRVRKSEPRQDSSLRRTALITDGDQRASLAIVRSLAAAGYRCIVCSDSGPSLAGSSRGASVEVAVPDSGHAPDAFAARVEELVNEHGIDLVIPVTESAMLAILPRRSTIPARIPFAELDVFRAVCDKGRVLEVAASAGISVPRQQQILSLDDAVDPAMGLPLVLKPHASVVTDGGGTRRKLSVQWAHTHEQLKQAIAGFPPAAYPVLAQQVVSGPGIGIFVLVHEGELLASFAHRRIREKPPSGGVSVLRQSEPVDPELLEHSLALLRAFGWSGVAMVEYKIHEATGEAVLMEINGRFWGSLQLAIDAGVDFPKLLAAVSFGDPLSRTDRFEFVRSRWFWGDVDHLLSRWRSRDSTWRDRAGALAAFLSAFGPGYRSEVFRWSDPWPFIRETSAWLRHVFRR